MKWKDIKNYEGLYQISKEGEVKSLITNKILKPKIHHSGYYHLTLVKNKSNKNKLVHRLVAETFIPNPNNKPNVNHKDGDKTNYNIDNLEWVTRSENLLHSFSNNLHKSKLTLDNVKEIKKSKLSNPELAKKFNVNASHICRIKNGIKWNDRLKYEVKK